MKKFNYKFYIAVLLAMVIVVESSIPVLAANKYVTYPYDINGISIDWDNWLSWLNKILNNDQSIEDSESEVENPVKEEYLAPSNITVTSSLSGETRRMKFEWEKIEGADKYIAQLSISPDFPEDDMKESINSNTYRSYRIFSSTGIYYYPAHATYYFRVKAVYGEHESEWSKVVVSHGDSK